ncbi:MAG: nucleotidyltransferase domain-containing protein [Anaerolineae bacterium]|nr:nucleotidyltransferase domain-containing protein [Anaerolineae bacterium]
MLSDAQLSKLVEIIATSSALTGISGQAVDSICLAGSHARGEATVYSDVDIYVFVADVVDLNSIATYQLHEYEGVLLSISITTIERKRAELAHPETAIWAVPGLRQLRVLYDLANPHGLSPLGNLRQEALTFAWLPLKPLADAYVSKQLCGYAEEAHKILSSLHRNDVSALHYATYGLLFGLTSIVAVGRGLLIESENRLFQLVQEQVGWESDWSHAFRRASLWSTAIKPPSQGTTIEERAQASLQLYVETALLFADIIKPEHSAVIQTTLKLIRQIT